MGDACQMPALVTRRHTPLRIRIPNGRTFAVGCGARLAQHGAAGTHDMPAHQLTERGRRPRAQQLLLHLHRVAAQRLPQLPLGLL
eukprot:6348966-Pyramimonas_sp.AAC.1